LTEEHLSKRRGMAILESRTPTAYSHHTGRAGTKHRDMHLPIQRLANCTQHMIDVKYTWKSTGEWSEAVLNKIPNNRDMAT
jgi:hypothetical protein